MAVASAGRRVGDSGYRPGVSSQPEPPPLEGGAVNYAGPVRVWYRPKSDGRADAGEVVWAWVAYDEDPSVGKDRPLVLIGWTADRRLAALMLSSRDHQGDRGWLRLGRGPWDLQGRTSWVRLDRMLAIRPSAVRREGSMLSRPAFTAVIDALAAEPGMAQALVRRRPALLSRLRSWLVRPSRGSGRDRRAGPGRSR